MLLSSSLSIPSSIGTESSTVGTFLTWPHRNHSFVDAWYFFLNAWCPLSMCADVRDSCKLDRLNPRWIPKGWCLDTLLSRYSNLFCFKVMFNHLITSLCSFNTKTSSRSCPRSSEFAQLIWWPSGGHPEVQAVTSISTHQGPTCFINCASLVQTV